MGFDISNKIREEERNMIFLSEKTEDAWSTACYAAEYWLKHHHGIVFAQVYEKPAYGQVLLRNILPLLKQIAASELMELRRRFVRYFNLDENRTLIYPFEGTRLAFVNYGIHQFNPGLLVIKPGRNSYRAYCLQCYRTLRWISESPVPVFLIPENTSDNPLKRVLFLSSREMFVLDRFNRFSNITAKIKDAIIDFYTIAGSGQELNLWKAYVAKIFGNSVLQSGKSGQLTIGQIRNLSDNLHLYDLVIIDREITGPLFRNGLHFRKWIENDKGIPLLIC